MAGMLEDDKGNTSYMRGASMASLVYAMAVGAILILKPLEDPSTGLYVFTAFLLGAFAPKAVQKFAEAKIPK